MIVTIYQAVCLVIDTTNISHHSGIVSYKAVIPLNVVVHGLITHSALYLSFAMDSVGLVFCGMWTIMPEN